MDPRGIESSTSGEVDGDISVLKVSDLGVVYLRIDTQVTNCYRIDSVTNISHVPLFA